MVEATFHHVQDAGLQQHRVAFRGQCHGLGRLEQVKHVGLGTEVQLRGLFLHVDVDAMNAAPDALEKRREFKLQDLTWLLADSLMWVRHRDE